MLATSGGVGLRAAALSMTKERFLGSYYVSRACQGGDRLVRNRKLVGVGVRDHHRT